MSFAGPTSPTMQRHIREYLGPDRDRVTMPAIIFGSRRDPLLALADQMAGDLFERCDLVVADEERPYSNHALPDDPACYAPIVRFLTTQQTEGEHRERTLSPMERALRPSEPVVTLPIAGDGATSRPGSWPWDK